MNDDYSFFFRTGMIGGFIFVLSFFYVMTPWYWTTLIYCTYGLWMYGLLKERHRSMWRTMILWLPAVLCFQEESWLE